MTMCPVPYVLIVAGSDPSGCAGLQADLKTVTNVHAATVVTALTAGNTRGVSDVRTVSADFVLAQLQAVLSDFGAGIVKTGVLPNAETIRTLKRALDEVPPLGLVADPVLLTKTGEQIADDSAISAWKSLLPYATLVTPSASEAALLTSLPVRNLAEAEHAAQALHELGAQAVLIKGRELQDTPEMVTDVFCPRYGCVRMPAPREQTQSHGTGDTLASAIAANLAQGIPLERAIRLAQAYVRHLLSHALSRGSDLPNSSKHLTRQSG